MLWVFLGASEQGKFELARQAYHRFYGDEAELAEAELGASLDKISQQQLSPKQLLDLWYGLVDFPLVDHLHLYIRALLVSLGETATDEALARWLSLLADKLDRSGSDNLQILILDDIGSGIVPLAVEDRLWREVCGRFYCRLTQMAARVDRVWAGLAQTLKPIQSCDV